MNNYTGNSRLKAQELVENKVLLIIAGESMGLSCTTPTGWKPFSNKTSYFRLLIGNSSVLMTLIVNIPYIWDRILSKWWGPPGWGVVPSSRDPGKPRTNSPLFEQRAEWGQVSQGCPSQQFCQRPPLPRAVAQGFWLHTAISQERPPHPFLRYISNRGTAT